MRVLPILILGAIMAEIAVMIAVGRWVGGLLVMVLLILDVFAGISVIRTTGLNLSQAMQMGSTRPEFASNLATSSLMRFIAGLLLIAPGFLSDVAALALLVPTFQGWVARRFSSHIEVRSAGWTAGPRQDGPIIEGEAVEISGEIIEPQPRPDQR
jgi:UPF0716 protein FxsA